MVIAYRDYLGLSGVPDPGDPPDPSPGQRFVLEDGPLFVSGTVAFVVSRVPGIPALRWSDPAAVAHLCLAVVGGRACFLYLGEDEVVA